jgi:hypothetical protein
MGRDPDLLCLAGGGLSFFVAQKIRTKFIESLVLSFLSTQNGDVSEDCVVRYTSTLFGFNILLMTDNLTLSDTSPGEC